MWITSIQGSISVVQSEHDVDQLLVKAKQKDELSRLFDEKRIKQLDGERECQYYTTVCKQEFADTMIKLIKEIDYTDFELADIQIHAVMDRI